MARNHVNYCFGQYSIEPMGLDVEKTCTTLTGTLCEVKEKVTFKKTKTYHWLSLGFDPDSTGPTRRIFFNVSKNKEILWLFQMAKEGLILQEGDDITIKYSGKSVIMIVNGEELAKLTPSKTSALCKELYKCRRVDSIDEVLRKVCSWALPADVRDEVEGESAYRCKEMLFNMIWDARDEELQLLISKLFFPEAVLMNFKEIREKLRKILSEKSLIEILSSEIETFVEPESERESSVDSENDKESTNEFAINDFTN